MTIAAWHASAGRWIEAERLYSQANEVDPFRRKLHIEWAAALVQLKRFAEALREYEVCSKVPPTLDLDKPEALTKPEEADLLGKQASCLVELGRSGEAMQRIEQALQMDSTCASALAARARLP